MGQHAEHGPLVMPAAAGRARLGTPGRAAMVLGVAAALAALAAGMGREDGAPLAPPLVPASAPAASVTAPAVDRPPQRQLPLAVVAAARGQIGVTMRYDPAYAVLDFPGGDVQRDRGVCIDVVVRALRDGAGIDLQRAVNRDMRARFAAYPRIWRLRAPDPNIDHRRVPNVAALLDHLGARLPADAVLQPGDIVTSQVGGRPHVVVVSDRRGRSGRPLAIHNIGRGTREEDVIALLPETGRYRLTPAVISRLRALDAGPAAGVAADQ